MYTNAYLKNYSISFQTLKSQKTEYYNMLNNRKEVLSYLGKSIFFMPYPKNSIFLYNTNEIYGYDFHIDRYLDLITGFESKTKLTFIKSDNYDSYFNNGKSKYILIETDKKNEAYIRKYYPKYKLTDTVNIYQVYSFADR